MGRGDAAHMQSVLGRLPTAAHCSLQIVKDPKIHIKCPRPQQKKNTFCSPITFLTMHVLPPANGKKLWRVKRRSVSGSMAQTDASSLECFNSSMKMSAAGKQSMARRPPLKRPKSKPGMPKDFVFVDLSPVKSDSDSASASFVKNGDNSPNIAATAPIPPPLQSPRPDESIGGCFVGNGAELSQVVPGGAYEGYDTSGASSPTTCFSHNSPSSTFSSTDAFSNYSFSSDDLFDEQLLGLGLVGVEFPKNEGISYSYNNNNNENSFENAHFNAQLPTPQISTPPQVSPVAPSHVRTHSMPSLPETAKLNEAKTKKSRKSAGGFQFKSYQGPQSGVKKRRGSHKRCFSEPVKKQPSIQQATPPTASLEDFLHPAAGKEVDGSLLDEMAPFVYSPESEGEFDLGRFISI
ncbi:hypothetical protein CJJ07_002283 [Candidozyma auris]|nr:hypothetical protein CJJ07_002283 [[Candida] auris]